MFGLIKKTEGIYESKYLTLVPTDEGKGDTKKNMENCELKSEI